MALKLKAIGLFVKDMATVMGKRAVVIIFVCILLSGCSTLDNETQSYVEAPSESVSSTGNFAEKSSLPQVTLPYQLDERLPEGLREVVIYNRVQVFKPINTEKLEEVLEQYFADGPNAELDQLIASQVQIQPTANPTVLTMEQVEHELTFLMGYLKCSYAGYGYFGGDSFFIPLQQTIYNEAKEYGDTILIESYVSIIDKHLLPVIQDRHFYIGSTAYGDPYAFPLYRLIFCPAIRGGGNTSAEQSVWLSATMMAASQATQNCVPPSKKLKSGCGWTGNPPPLWAETLRMFMVLISG